MVEDELLLFPDDPLEDELPAELLPEEELLLEELPAEELSEDPLPEPLPSFLVSFELLPGEPVLSLLMTFFLSPVLKSVSYQPLPFNLKATAEICFFNSGF